MYRRILVPTDLTNRTLESLEAASNIAAPGDARITLLHVIETIAGAEDKEVAAFTQYGHVQFAISGRSVPCSCA